MKKILNNKGISLISLTITVVVILILTSIILYNASKDVKISNLSALQSDIVNLQDKVASYYAQYGKIPAITSNEYTNIDDIKNAGVISSSVDTGKFYVIDLSAMENVTLNYGKDYEKVRTGEAQTSEQINNLKDIYIINETSHNIFYVEGIKIDNEQYYTNYSSDEVDKVAVNLRYYDDVEIPDGFYYVGGNKQTGLVISDVQGDDLLNSKFGNQFVWVPVEKEWNYVRNNKVTTDGITSEKGYLPNDLVEGVDDSEHNAEAEKNAVMRAGGFFISRYEASEISGKIVSKKSGTAIGSTETLANVENLAKSFKNDNSVKSALASSIQWDLSANMIDINSTENSYRFVLYVIPRDNWSAEYDKTTTYTDVNKDTAVIPQGYKVSRKVSERTITNGLVIQGKDGSEFVWIPVSDVIYNNINTIKENYTPMAEIQSDSKSNYQGILYDFSGTKNIYKSDYKIGTTSYREPSLITGNTNDLKAVLSNVSGNMYDALSSNYGLLGYSNSKSFGDDLQKQYDLMVASVEKYKGFYVGRYELGLDGTKPVTKNVKENTGLVMASTNNSNCKNWYGLYNMSKKYTAEKTTSSMIWGSQYDAMMNWIAKQGKDVSSQNLIKRNSDKNTGSSKIDVINNIYDLYGSMYEATLEANDVKNRVERGGGWNSDNGPSARNLVDPSATSADVGTRLALYIND